MTESYYGIPWMHYAGLTWKVFILRCGPRRVLFRLVFGDVKQITRWNSRGNGMKAEEQVIEIDRSITRPIINLDSEAQAGTRHLSYSSHVGGHCVVWLSVWIRDTT